MEEERVVGGPDPQPGDISPFGYVVANPYRLAKTERIFSWEDMEWFEGNAFHHPYGMPLDMVEYLIDEGILVPSSSDGSD